MGFPSLQSRGSEPPRSQGTCVDRPLALTAHREPWGRSLLPLPSYLPTPSPRTPGTGPQPSFLTDSGDRPLAPSPLRPYPSWEPQKAPASVPQGAPRTSPLNRETRRQNQPPSIKTLSPNSSQGPPAQFTSPATAHRDPGRRIPSTVLPQRPRAQGETSSWGPQPVLLTGPHHWQVAGFTELDTSSP